MTFKPFVGLITNGLFRKHYNQIKDNLPQQWRRILKTEDPYNGKLDTVFLLQKVGARCSSVVRAFAHGAWGGPIELFLVPASAPRLV